MHSPNNEPASAGQTKILWWIIGILTTVSFGAGSSYVTRLDGMAQLKAEVRSLAEDVRELKAAIEHKLGKSH